MLRDIAKAHAGGCGMLAKHSDNGLLTVIGTAFLCHEKGYALTCAHAFSLLDRLVFVFPQPIDQFVPITLAKVIPIDMTVVQYDAENDVALLKTTSPMSITMPSNILGTDGASPVGASVCYLGFPFGHSGQHALKVSSSILSSKVLSTNGTKQFRFDAMVDSGNSGGPLIDVNSGQIIGIVSGRFSPVGNGFGISIGSHRLGTESAISYATAIGHGKALMVSEGLNA